MQEENAKLCDVFMRWLLGEAGVRFPRRREYELSESRRVPNTESLADRLRCCLQVTLTSRLRENPKIVCVCVYVSACVCLFR